MSLTFALVCIILGGSFPHSVPVVIQTPFAVGSVSAVLAQALHCRVVVGVLLFDFDALVGMTIALASVEVFNA